MDDLLKDHRYRMDWRRNGELTPGVEVTTRRETGACVALSPYFLYILCAREGKFSQRIEVKIPGLGNGAEGRL
jgi:hypothetical protein